MTFPSQYNALNVSMNAKSLQSLFGCAIPAVVLLFLAGCCCPQRNAGPTPVSYEIYAHKDGPDRVLVGGVPPIGIPKGSLILWRKDGALLLESGEYQLPPVTAPVYHDHHSLVLEIPMLSPAHAGQYQCEIWHKGRPIAVSSRHLIAGGRGPGLLDVTVPSTIHLTGTGAGSTCPQPWRAGIRSLTRYEATNTTLTCTITNATPLPAGVVMSLQVTPTVAGPAPYCKYPGTTDTARLTTTFPPIPATKGAKYIVGVFFNPSPANSNQPVSNFWINITGVK